MTEKIIIDKTVIDNLVEKANLEPTGNSNDWNVTNPAWVDGYKEGMLQAVNAVMTTIYLADTPPFAVGEYYVYNITIFKVLENADRYLKTLELTAGKLREDGFYKSGRRYTESTPATAEQIAEFHRAEQFAAKGRKLDEFRVGDRAMDERGKVFTVTHITNGYLFNNTEIIDSVMKARLIKFMEDENEI